MTSMVLPSWVIAVVFPVRAGPDTISPDRPKGAERFMWASRRPVVTTSRTAGVWMTSSREWWAIRSSS
jgi:hypothetical protein